MKNIKKLAIISVMTLSACGPTVIMLKNTKTGEIVRCGTGPSGMPSEAKTCADAYEANGYERILKK